MKTIEIYLVDNGSLRPEATLALRGMALQLSERVGQPVRAVSLLHSHKIDPEFLGGEAASIVKRRMRLAIEQGQRHFLFLPLFLGPSLAITDYLPQLIEEARTTTPNLQAVIAEPLAGEAVEAPDGRLAEILAEQVRDCVSAEGLIRPRVALVDHGTPIRTVNILRNAVAEQLGELLGNTVSGVTACSMERRPSPEYAFNEPLLERLTGTLAGVVSALVVAMFFILPGRHAGEGGDVAEICDRLVSGGRFSALHKTPLLGAHPRVLEILKDRLEQGMERLSKSA